MTEHIVAVFHNAAEAEAAERELQLAGVPAVGIRRYAGTSYGTTSAPSGAQVQSAQPSGFWAWLLGEETPTRSDWSTDADLYDRRTSAGDTVLSVTLTDDSQIHRTVEILEAHNPIGIDETADEAQAGMATSTAASTQAGMATAAAATPQTGAATATGAMPQAGTATASMATPQAGSMQGQEEVIQLAKEEIEVGKRQVERGTTRIRRYVVETPVERELTLRSERVTVERRSPTTVAGSVPGQFEERVVEVRETEEVPVVQKTASVNEEVVIRREPTERTEVVRDTVRREEVDVTPDTPEKKPE